MPAATFTTFQLSCEEAIFVESCLARRRELMALADTAPVGDVLRQCEDSTVSIAQKFGSDLLEDALTRRIANFEEKKG